MINSGDKYTQLKDRVRKEVKRRKYTGSVASYGDTNYDFNTTPAEGVAIDKEHYNKLLEPTRAINPAGLPDPVNNGDEVINTDIIDAKLTTFESKSMTTFQSNTGCASSCTGLCATTCTGTCTGTCSGNCSSCSGTCSGSCSGGCSGNCRGCSGSCSGGCRGGCDGCGGSCSYNCSGGCEGCSTCGLGCGGSCSSGCDSSCSNQCSLGCKGTSDGYCSGGCGGSCGNNCSDCSGCGNNVFTIIPKPIIEESPIMITKANNK